MLPISEQTRLSAYDSLLTYMMFVSQTGKELLERQHQDLTKIPLCLEMAEGAMPAPAKYFAYPVDKRECRPDQLCE